MSFVNPGNDFATTRDTELVTVAQLNPDSGATITSVSSVPAVRQSIEGAPVNVGSGGQVPARLIAWAFPNTNITWTVKTRDRITDANNVTYLVDTASLDPDSGVWDVKTVKER